MADRYVSVPMTLSNT